MRRLSDEPKLQPLARLASTILIVGLAIGLCIYLSGLTEAPRAVRDVDAYWNAANRLIDGQPLYPVLTNSGAETTYRYAPWFAFLWVPMTFLGKGLAYGIWTALLIVGAACAVWPLLRARRLSALLLAALLSPYLAQAIGQGNVQPLLVGGLALTAGRRAGPAAIGVAASLKFFPIAYVVILAARREWRQCAVGLAIFGLLVLPTLLFDLSHYPVSPELTGSLWAISPLAWGIGAIAAMVLALWLAKTPFAWLGGSLLVFMLSPRVTSYDQTILLVTGRDETGRMKWA